MSRLDALRTAALPFVTRSLRGGRLRRLLSLSLMLSVLTVILGTWITFGDGDFEEDVRVAFDLEESRWSRQQNDYVIIVDSDEEAALLQAELGRAVYSLDRATGYYTQTQSTIDDGIATLRWAATANTDRSTADDARAAQQILDRAGLPTIAPDSQTTWSWFNWYTEEHARRARSIIAKNLVPTIEVYHSPLSTVDAVRITGAIAGGFLGLLLLVFGPLLAGTQIAQEVHENTLQPLTGTSLRARELILGLTAGALLPVAIVAAPQVLLLLATVAFVGHPIAAVGGLVTGVVGCFFLSMLAQLLGHTLGAQRSPGVLGVSLLGFLGVLGIIGAVFGLNPTRATLGVFTLLPEASTAHLLRSSLIPHPMFAHDACAAHSADWAVVLGTVGLGVLGLLGLRTLQRRIERTSAPALTRGEALLGAVVSSLLIVLANPGRVSGYSGEAYYVLNLALIAVPFAALLMMRVPVGDAPATLRRVPTAALLGELGLWALIQGIAAVALEHGHHESSMLLQPVAVFYTAWYFAVVGLLALRVAARPLGLASRIWVAFAAVFALIALPHVGRWIRPYHGSDVDHLFMLGQASPFLGLVQVILMVVVPLTLLRALRRPARG
ncbi:MAG: hypothetical protein R3B09_21535 [Nannocystaceae bacterium]